MLGTLAVLKRVDRRAAVQLENSVVARLVAVLRVRADRSPGTERAVARLSLVQEQHVAHVIPKLAVGDFHSACFFVRALGFVDGPLLTIVVASLRYSSTSLLGSSPS